MEEEVEFNPSEWQTNSFARAVYNQPSRRYGKTSALEKQSATNYTSMFEVGQIVKLKTGTAPQRVVKILYSITMQRVEIKCEYLDYRKELDFRPEADYEIYIETRPDKSKEDPMKGKLFQTLDGSVYGEGLVIDGDGKYVLKLNSGDYKAFAPAELKRVMPYTYDVVFNGMSNKRYSYLGKAGSVEVGDILIEANDFTIARVVAVGTESDAATKKFTGFKLVTAALE
jgi:hypothetical protein